MLHDFFSFWTHILSILSTCLQNSNLCPHSYKKAVEIISFAFMKYMYILTAL